MKTQKLRLCLLIISTLSILVSCDKIYGPYQYEPTVNFDTTQISINENGIAVTRKIFVHNNIGLKDGKAYVKINGVPETGFDSAVYNVDYTIEPAPQELNGNLFWDLSQLSDTFSFSIHPIQNKKSIEAHKIKMQITSTAGGMAVGGQSILYTTITNIDKSIEGYSVTTSLSILNFSTTPIALGQTSAPQQLDITGVGLTKDVLVQAPVGFKVSYDESKDVLRDAILLSAAIANNKVKIWVRFAPPLSSTKGSKSGILTIQTYGVEVKKVVLVGKAI